MTAGGSCIVDVVLADLGTSARASYEDLARAASEIQQRCVRTYGVGGIATDVGKIFDRFHSNLSRLARLTDIFFSRRRWRS